MSRWERRHIPDALRRILNSLSLDWSHESHTNAAKYAYIVKQLHKLKLRKLFKKNTPFDV